MTDLQDLVNDLATAARARYVQQVAYAGYMLGLRSNGIAISEVRLHPYMTALNATNDRCDRIVREIDHIVYRNAKRPSRHASHVSFNAKHACTTSCLTARGHVCDCACGGAGHGMGLVFGRHFGVGGRAQKAVA